MIQNVENIRDLLIAKIAPEMGRARDDGTMRRRYYEPDLDYDEAIVAWVLDAMTIEGLELMLELRKQEQGWDQ